MENNQHPLWDLRYKLFSKFDEWVQYDDIWLSSTKPEEISKKVWNITKWNIVFDCFCWLGSNAIWFALSWKKVITCELNNERLEMAKNNAKLYWVYDKITFINWNILDYIDKFDYDIAYFDPPWSTNWVYYFDKWKYKFSDYEIDWISLINLARKKTNNIIFALPKNFDFNELNIFNWDFNLTREFINGKLFLFNLFLDKKNDFSTYSESVFPIIELNKFIQDNFINISKEFPDYKSKKIVYNNTLDYLRNAFLRTAQDKHQLVLNWYLSDTNRLIKYVEENFIYKDAGNLGIDFIKWLHKNLFPEWFIAKNKDTNWREFIQMIPGEFRKINLISKTNPNQNIYSKYQNIENSFKIIIQNFNKSDKRIDDILLFASDFSRVHPFWDWNGRTLDILTDLLLLKNWFNPLYLWDLKTKDELWFYKILDEVYETRDVKLFYDFIEAHKNS